MAHRKPFLKRLKIAVRRGRPLVWDGEENSLAVGAFDFPTTSRNRIGEHIKVEVTYTIRSGPRRLLGLIPVGVWERHSFQLTYDGIGPTVFDRAPEGIPSGVEHYGPLNTTPRRWLMWELAVIRNRKVSDPYNVTTTP